MILVWVFEFRKRCPPLPACQFSVDPHGLASVLASVRQITLRAHWYFAPVGEAHLLRTILESGLYVPHVKWPVCCGLTGMRFVTRMARSCTRREQH
jgi:hypothetical protein